MYRYRAAVLGLIAVFTLSACDSDGTGPQGDALSEEEASALSSAIVGQSLQVGSMALQDVEAQAPAGAPAAAPVPFTHETTVTDVPCPEGGTVSASVSASGTADAETGAFDVSFELSATHNDCGVVHEESGRVFVLNTVDGNDLTLNMDFALDAEQQLTANGDYSGRVDWSTEGKEGECSVTAEFDISGDLEAGTFTGSVSGEACGVGFSRTTTVG